MQRAIGKQRLVELQAWFTQYARSFQCDGPEIQHIIDLKEKHTMRVCKEILYIGNKLGLNDNQLRLAEIIALFHDIGRFEQYARYKTFLDSASENHAELGIQVLERFKVLDPFEDDIKNVILKAVKFHNRAALPPDNGEDYIFYAKLIRDADKLDIWKVVTDYYSADPGKNRAIGLDLPHTDGFSSEVLQDLTSRKIVDIQHIRNLNDLKLFQVGWIFDINFKPTLDCIRKRRYLEKLRSVLPESKQLDTIFDIIDVSCFQYVIEKS